MALFTQELFATKLRKMAPTQSSVQTVSEWVMFHEKPEETAAIWKDEIITAPSERKILYLNLSNDILQNSRKSKDIGNIFVEAFGDIMMETLLEVYPSCSSHDKSAIDRLLQIWEVRAVFTAGFLSKLREKCGIEAVSEKKKRKTRESKEKKKKKKKFKYAGNPHEVHSADSVKGLISTLTELVNSREIDKSSSEKCRIAIAEIGASTTPLPPLPPSTVASHCACLSAHQQCMLTRVERLQRVHSLLESCSKYFERESKIAKREIEECARHLKRFPQNSTEISNGVSGGGFLSQISPAQNPTPLSTSSSQMNPATAQTSFGNPNIQYTSMVPAALQNVHISTPYSTYTPSTYSGSESRSDPQTSQSLGMSIPSSAQSGWSGTTSDSQATHMPQSLLNSVAMSMPTSVPTQSGWTSVPLGDHQSSTQSPNVDSF
eukprot:759411_1